VGFVEPEEISRRACELFQERGREPGYGSMIGCVPNTN
jgi:hypothetical protein